MATVHIHFPEDESPTVLNLTGSRVSVGRLPHNTIQIIDRTVSALHAEFIREGEHYRLHDRDSANGTFVDGEAVTDYHLREACKIGFGAFECEFSPAVAVAHAEESLENLPSRGEINEVRHDNAKLRNQVELLREEVEALSKAPSEGSGGDAVTLPREEFVRIVGELEKLKESQLQSGEELKRLKNNLSVLQRDRANLQRALDDARSETLKARSAPAPAVSARAIPRDEPVTAPEGAAVEESPEAAAAPEVPAETPPPFKPAGRPPIQPGKLSVPNPQTLPAKGPTVTQPQPFAPASAPKAQPGSGSGIRPFPKANPPGTVSKPTLAGAHPIAQGTQAKPSPLQPVKAFAKVPVATPAGSGPKGTQRITIPPPH